MKQEVIGVKDYFNIMLKHFWMISLITLIITGISVYVTFYVLTPIYQAKTQLLVMNTTIPQETVPAQQGIKPIPDIRYEQEIKATYIDLIKSPFILEEVNEKLAIEGYKVKENNLVIESPENSQVITIFVEDSDPSGAALIANTISETFKEKIVDRTTIDNVQILIDAKIDPSPVKPKPIFNIGISVVVGLILSITLAFLLEILGKNKTKKGKNEKVSL